MERRMRRTGVFVLTCVFLTAPAIQAKVLRVGSSPAAGYRSIGSAVSAAAGGDVIIVEQGTYRGDGNRDIVVSQKAITIRSIDPNDPDVVAATVINCEGTASLNRRAFDILSGDAARLDLEGLTITNGYGPLNGGTVLCQGAEFRAYNCTFSNNYVAGWGSAVSCRDSQVWFEGCLFSNNTCVSTDRGAIFCSTSIAEVEGCTFQSNRGGAIVGFDSQVTASRCVFETNTAENGGAIYSCVSSNTAFSSELVLLGCTFTANAASASGGAVHVVDFAPQIDGCTFTANTAVQDGGAILSCRASSVLTNNVFVSNIAGGLGGGMHSVYKGAPQITNCTFVANEASQGGAIAGTGNVRQVISHSILWDNTAGVGESLYLARFGLASVKGGTATVEYCDLEGGQNATYAELDCTLTWSDGNIDVDPLFTGPAYDDYRLSPDSPCIDVGNPAYAPSSDVADRDGYARQFGTAVDLGAYEFHGLSPIYRFWSPTLGKYFYTLLGAERNHVVNLYPYDWHYVDVAYYAYYQPIVDSLVPVYRFWSPVYESHFWTVSEEECQHVIETYPTIWTYEGIVFYAFPQGSQPLDTFPVYRFWSSDLTCHAYTMDENEKDDLIANYSDLWAFEGVAWYSYPQVKDLREVSYAFRGGSEGAWCMCTLAATIDGQEAQISSADVRLTPASTQMQMTIDFRGLTVTLDTLSVRTQTIEHTTDITLAGEGVTIPLVLSAQASFRLPSARGPYTVDPTTHLFADYRQNSQNLAGKDSVFSYSGSVFLNGQETPFNRTMSSTRFELESVGEFAALSLLPDGLYAGVPLTFQWHRQQTRDLLAEAQVDGRRVQIYVVYSYVGTQGLWEGAVVE